MFNTEATHNVVVVVVVFSEEGIPFLLRHMDHVLFLGDQVSQLKLVLAVETVELNQVPLTVDFLTATEKRNQLVVLFLDWGQLFVIACFTSLTLLTEFLLREVMLWLSMLWLRLKTVLLYLIKVATVQTVASRPGLLCLFVPGIINLTIFLVLAVLLCLLRIILCPVGIPAHKLQESLSLDSILIQFLSGYGWLLVSYSTDNC